MLGGISLNLFNYLVGSIGSIVAVGAFDGCGE